jgi:hypothetical protein
MKRRGRHEVTPEAARASSPEEELHAAVSGSGGSAGPSSVERRQLRPRPALNYSDQHPVLDAVLGGEEEDGRYAGRRRLDVARFCALVEHAAHAQRFTAATHPAHVTAEALAAAGLRQPLYVPADGAGAGGVAATRAALGLQLSPEGRLTPAGLAAALGEDHPVGLRRFAPAWLCRAAPHSRLVCLVGVMPLEAAGPVAAAPAARPAAAASSCCSASALAAVQVPTIDVATQGSGPTLTMGQLAQYLERMQGARSAGARRRRSASPNAQPPPARLLNVVSLSLAGTPLEVRALLRAATCRVHTASSTPPLATVARRLRSGRSCRAAAARRPAAPRMLWALPGRCGGWIWCLPCGPATTTRTAGRAATGRGRRRRSGQRPCSTPCWVSAPSARTASCPPAAEPISRCTLVQRQH